ncbi:MAG: 7-carboxy-7-deazaguanine synthase [Deltaproteobacteria bacterium]|nr:7-carboxy-7-deazaguanine synthase [Deltaproteobacteria bacterium]
MTYAIKECFFTLQGEGAQSGRAAVFLRFTGCNLWSGREADRASARGGCGRWCDTDFVGTDGEGGGRFESAETLANYVQKCWQSVASDAETPSPERYVVCTGGEPLLQLDTALIEALHARGFAIAIESNGTLPVPPGIDWVCISPKAGGELVVTEGDELKLVYPQPEEHMTPEHFGSLRFANRFLQPLDGLLRAKHTAACIAYCRTHPAWRLSVQMHKLVGIA